MVRCLLLSVLINRVVVLELVGWYKGIASAKACLNHCRDLHTTHEVTRRAGAVVNHDGAWLTFVLQLLSRRRVLR